MHPAKSVILFTSLSGAGYGLLIMLLAFDMASVNSLSLDVFNAAMFTAFSMVTVGLMSSTFHLGHPERAWRAISQWRSSWLSREGVLALICFIPWISLVVVKNYSPENLTLFSFLAYLTIIIALGTVFATAMIYRSLRPVQAWYHPSVVIIYLWLALASGAFLLSTFLSLVGPMTTLFWQFECLMIVGAVILKIYYWKYIVDRPSPSTIESATGLGKFGKVKSFEWPHNNANYLMQEMGFQIARKHSIKLRSMVTFMWAVLFFVLVAAGIYSHSLSFFDFATNLAFALLFFLGILLERWLFFAEAKHDQALYYGQN